MRKFKSPTLQRLKLEITEQEKLEMILENERIQRERREMIEWANKIKQEDEDWN